MVWTAHSPGPTWLTCPECGGSARRMCAAKTASRAWELLKLPGCAARFHRRRIRSGKSTLARHLAARLGVPHIELDAIFHQPGWKPLPPRQFAQRVTEVASGDGWVIDGNYSIVQRVVWRRADTVIWLDLPRRTVMRRIIWRTVRRLVTGGELWNGNRERWRNLLTWDPEQSVISWAWHHYGTYRDRYSAAILDPAYRHLTFIRITRPAELRRITGSGP